MVLALGTGSVAGPLGHAHSVLGLGFSAVAGFRGCHPVRVPARNGCVARVRVYGCLRTIRALRHTHSILALGFAAITGLGSRYPVLIFVSDSGIVRIRVDRSGGVTVLANLLAAQVGDAILRQ